jgi:hypothetical protein
MELDNLKNTPTRKEPLDPTYDRALGQLNRQSEECVKLGFKILSWLSKARRTLTVEELRIAILVEPGTYELDDLDLPDRMTLTDVCAGLVVIEENSNTIRFAHFTVLEWLVRKSIIPEKANLDIAVACLTYLTFDAFSGGPCASKPGDSGSLQDRLQKHQLLEYVAGHAPFHISQCDEEFTTEAFLQFLKCEGNMHSYLQVAIYFTGSYPYKDSRIESTRPIHIASGLGRTVAVQFLVEGGAEINARDDGDRTSLHLVAAEGHIETVQFLVEKGAEINAKDNDSWNYLHHAAEDGHIETVRFLVEKGVEINARDSGG